MTNMRSTPPNFGDKATEKKRVDVVDMVDVVDKLFPGCFKPVYEG